MAYHWQPITAKPWYPVTFGLRYCAEVAERSPTQVRRMFNSQGQVFLMFERGVKVELRTETGFPDFKLEPRAKTGFALGLRSVSTHWHQSNTQKASSRETETTRPTLTNL